jgi:hypothetical protein
MLFFASTPNSASFMAFKCHFLTKMSRKSVPEHFHHGVCNFQDMFGLNPMLNLFGGLFLGETHGWLLLITYIS